MLHDEEQRREFDIHTYGDEILGRLQSASPPSPAKAAPTSTPTPAPAVDFGAVLAAEGAPRFEVCRTFLATLILANAGNLEIVPPPAEDVNASEAGAATSSGRGGRSSAAAAPRDNAAASAVAAEARFASRTGTFGVRLLDASARGRVEAFEANIAEAAAGASAAAAAATSGASLPPTHGAKRVAVEDAHSGAPQPLLPSSAKQTAVPEPAHLRDISGAAAQRKPARGSVAKAAAGAGDAASAAPSPAKPGLNASPLAKRVRRGGRAVVADEN